MQAAVSSRGSCTVPRAPLMLYGSPQSVHGGAILLDLKLAHQKGSLCPHAVASTVPGWARQCLMHASGICMMIPLWVLHALHGAAKWYCLGYCMPCRALPNGTALGTVCLQDAA